MHIKDGLPHAGDIPLSLAFGVRLGKGTHMVQRSAALRFAVGRFDVWAQLEAGMQDARARGLLGDTFSCLALQRLFIGNTIKVLQRVLTLRFPDNAEAIACTESALADCLSDSLQSGARSLKGSLAEWDISRHASALEGAVLAGQILLWIKLTDAEDERRAYQTLLAHSSNLVDVHDLRPPIR